MTHTKTTHCDCDTSLNMLTPICDLFCLEIRLLSHLQYCFKPTVHVLHVILYLLTNQVTSCGAKWDKQTRRTSFVLLMREYAVISRNYFIAKIPVFKTKQNDYFWDSTQTWMDTKCESNSTIKFCGVVSPPTCHTTHTWNITLVTWQIKALACIFQTSPMPDVSATKNIPWR